LQFENFEMAKERQRPQFLPGFQKIIKGKGTEEKQFWFCLHDINGCVSARSKSIIHYPQIPRDWPVKVGTNLTQVEVEAFEAAGFQIDSGEVFDRMRERFLARYNNVPRGPQPPKGSGDIRPKMMGQSAISLHRQPFTRALCKNGIG
jgi:hypothetical protein